MGPNPNLKAAIVLRRSTQRKTSANTGIPETRLSDIINGRVRATDEEKAKLAKTLRYSTDKLFGRAALLMASHGALLVALHLI